MIRCWHFKTQLSCSGTCKAEDRCWSVGPFLVNNAFLASFSSPFSSSITFSLLLLTFKPTFLIVSELIHYSSCASTYSSLRGHLKQAHASFSCSEGSNVTRRCGLSNLSRMKMGTHRPIEFLDLGVNTLSDAERIVCLNKIVELEEPVILAKNPWTSHPLITPHFDRVFLPSQSLWWGEQQS